jgi:hypothetical protein
MPGSLSEFLHDLAEHGRVHVHGYDAFLEADGALDEAITACDVTARLEASGTPPALDHSVARWATLLMYDGCRLLVYRELGRDIVASAFSRPCPGALSPSTIWSADLALCHLPALIALAAGLAPDDPLVAALHGLARQWPLSSVGISRLGAVDAGVIRANEALLALYVDRIIDSGDRERLDDPIVAEAVRTALGAHGGLKPGLVEML